MKRICNCNVSFDAEGRHELYLTDAEFSAIRFALHCALASREEYLILLKDSSSAPIIQGEIETLKSLLDNQNTEYVIKDESDANLCQD